MDEYFKITKPQIIREDKDEIKIKEAEHYLGNNITKGAAEYISIILGL